MINTSGSTRTRRQQLLPSIAATYYVVLVASGGPSQR